MYPSKHIKDLEKSIFRANLIRKILFASIFLVSTTILGGIIHEIGHLVAAYAINCNYEFFHGIGVFTGFHGRIGLNCNITLLENLVINLAGYLNLILLGSSSIILVKILSRPWKFVLSSFSSGLFVSLLISVNMNGDFRNISDLLGSDLILILGNLFLLLIGLTGSYLSLKFYFDSQNGRKERETIE